MGAKKTKSNKTNKIWKYSDKEKHIDDMGTVEVLKCALHAMKRMYYYNKKFHYYDYRGKIAETKKEIDHYKDKRDSVHDILNLFCNKLEHLDDRAIDLGFEIPEEFEAVKQLLATFDD